MILIADSGSTKCDWVLLVDNELISTSTVGFNPFFHSEQYILSQLSGNQVLNGYADRIESVYYYGAGCSSPERNSFMRSVLSSHFKNANQWEVSEDLIGAAYATCGEEKGIVCILGTGSNSCYFDGKNVHVKFPALGHLLGDEGSGAYFGKKILKQHIRNQLPKEISELISEGTGLTKAELITRVYKQSDPNVFLASLVKIAAGRSDHPFLRETIRKGFVEFAETSILCFAESSKVPVHFVGSIAFIYEDILRKVGEELGFRVGRVIRKPIDQLVHFHVGDLVDPSSSV